jgi:hypothetical protein
MKKLKRKKWKMDKIKNRMKTMMIQTLNSKRMNKSLKITPNYII